ncbi:hypothetical protein [Dyella mobilis]|uniref:Uncharacterized protein n=1 Tax=Dyella mobilis TaxID=1849582 RepID=A0ABS2KHX4_9GAMM|nr:hypothetical protein [Dyella mobilis]MBM7130655.1 hypothetical protein [Dyella mobilis]
MQELRVEMIEQSMALSGSGAISGNIYFDFGIFQFPERAWSDTAVVIVEWWLTALNGLVMGRTDEVELRFMDGPFWLSVQRASGDECQVRCEDGLREQIQFQCRTSALELLRSTFGVATRLLQVCYQRQWSSADVETLERQVITVRELAGDWRLH